MNLRECLESLPLDMVMIDLAEISSRNRKTVVRLLETVRDEPGMEVRQEKYNYGRETRAVIGLIGGLTIFREDKG